MWSISSSNHTSHVGTYISELTSYIAKHRYLFIVLAVAFALIVMTSVFILQSSAASQRAHSEAVSNGQNSAHFAAVSNTTQEQLAPVTQQQESTQPTPNEASVSQSGAGTTVNINGETVNLSNNDSIHRVVQNDEGTTKVDVSVNSNSSGSNMSLNSTSVNVNNSSQSSQSSISINNSQ